MIPYCLLSSSAAFKLLASVSALLLSSSAFSPLHSFVFARRLVSRCFFIPSVASFRGDPLSPDLFNLFWTPLLLTSLLTPFLTRPLLSPLLSLFFLVLTTPALFPFRLLASRPQASLDATHIFLSSLHLTVNPTKTAEVVFNASHSLGLPPYSFTVFASPLSLATSH